MDKYEKVMKIGEGSFGKAILVKDKKDGHQYVIKEVCISGMSEKARQESRKEVAVLANMSHPNIVQYKESFEERGFLYIVMDYCEGGDLFKKINSQKGMFFPEEQILDWFVQICLALKYIHDRKILHRDIKSQNIFLTKDGTVQLGDFGIARVLNSTVELARTCIGTPYYLSPEICENKPYNNKSDIWALGCVLYEMCTLKHAFEAGNMKNLVLKIIRGSYHPVAVHYSSELRSILGQLFKHNPRERPSVSSILDKPFLFCRIQSFLPPQIIAQEFHHTIIQKQQKRVAYRGSEAKYPTHGFTPSVAAKITTPACKYGVPLTAKKVSVTRKSSDKKMATKDKMAPGSIYRSEVIKKRKMDLLDKEKKLRDQMKADQIKWHNKEKNSRINRAREEGWNDVLSSTGSPERKFHLGGGKRAADVSGCPVPRSRPSSVLSRNYGAALDQIARQSSEVGLSGEGSAGPGSPIRQKSAEHVYHVEEFLQRKKEAMLNKVRAEGQLGTRQNGATMYGDQVGSARFTRPIKVNKEEEDYLTRLRQIRLQNFNERQQIQARLRGEMYGSDSSESLESTDEAELRRKKMAVFKRVNPATKRPVDGPSILPNVRSTKRPGTKRLSTKRPVTGVSVQANARDAILKEQLEKKRREANQREKEAWNDHIAAQEERLPVATVSTTSKSTTVKSSTLPESPTPVISMTVALKNVGASEKKHILNRLNQNLKAQSPVDALELITTAAGEQNPTFQQKLFDSGNLPYIEESNKWDPKELPVLCDSQTVLEESCWTESNHPLFVGDRKKWQEQLPFFLPVSQQTLEETCIPTMVKNIGEVMQLSEGGGQRKAWGMSPECQILDVFHEAEAQPLTQLMETVGIYKEASPDNPNQSVAISTPGEDVSLKKRTTANVEVEALMEYVPTTDVSDPKQLSEMEAHMLPSSIAEIQDPEDVESMLWEDVPEVSHTSMGLHHAWEKQDQQPLLPGVSTNQGAAASAGKEGKIQLNSCLSQVEELLLSSSDHRRTSALALILAHSSVDESFSSLSRSRSVSPLHIREQNALLIGLSTGLFDANNPKMLRTCSLPDLSRVFSSEQDCVIVPENNISLDGDIENEDQSETEDVYDDDGLQDIRASMERLLQEESELTDNLRHDGKGDLNGNAKVVKDNYFFNQIIVKLKQDNNQMALVSDNADKYNDNEECSNADKEAVELLINGMGEENHTNENRLHEEWQSDNSEENHEGETELYDSIYSRLEEHRFNLEQQIGFEKFIDAYNRIKAIRDDEDDNIDLGTSLAFSILGNEHQHLYPNILHLVVADGAYQEGNDLPFKQ
ncbi:serine/threonine-protein kinase Nek1 isoform X6 [Stigmatopora argus]